MINYDEINNISSIKDFVSHFVTSKEIVSVETVEHKKENIALLCSHANTCKFRRNGCSINTCFHTKTCEFFCQKFIESQYLKKNNTHYENYINETKLAKIEKRLRNF